MSKMRQDYKSYDDLVKEVFEKAKQHIDGYRKREMEEDERHHVLYDMLDKELPRWRKKYYELLGIGPKPLTPEFPEEN